MRNVFKKVAAIALLTSSFPALSQWQIDNDYSTLSFISTKNSEIAEVHHFDKVMGSVDDNKGKVTFVIDLASVNTMIPIRDQRMRDFLFKTSEFSKATFSADVDTTFLKALPVGQQKQIKLSGEIDLHGQQQVVTTEVQIAKLTKDRLLVNSVKPVVLNAKSFKLAAGVAKLQEIAGLANISNAVPVSFSLTFVDK